MRWRIEGRTGCSCCRCCCVDHLISTYHLPRLPCSTNCRSGDAAGAQQGGAAGAAAVGWRHGVNERVTSGACCQLPWTVTDRLTDWLHQFRTGSLYNDQVCGSFVNCWQQAGWRFGRRGWGRQASQADSRTWDSRGEQESRAMAGWMQAAAVRRAAMSGRLKEGGRASAAQTRELGFDQAWQH